MLKIGEFSKLTGISIQTLRYYDAIDLLKPAEIDLFTGYRYYKEDQMEKLKMIHTLQSVGFTLEEIKTNWNHFTNDIMENKKKELESKRENINDSIKKIDILRSHIVDGKIIKEKPKESRKIKSLF